MRSTTPTALQAPPEDQMIPRARRGDCEAWAVLIEKYDRRVLLMLLARGVPADRARDITQETWARLIAHDQAGRLERLELPGLAFRQATFLSLDDQRHSKRASLPAADEEIAFLRDPGPDVEQRLVTRAELARASEELDRCPPRARRIFELVYENPDVPQAVTARRLGMSVQRLRHVVCEVRARLRAALYDDKDPLAFTRGRTPESFDE